MPFTCVPFRFEYVFESLEPKTDNQLAVTVTVTLIDISPQSKEWKFDIVIDTHSVELNQNMAEISALIDGQEREYKPLRFEGASAGCHHKEGVLVFDRITPTPKSVELKITGIANATRSFVWQFEQ